MADLFLEKLVGRYRVSESGCWLWQGSRNSNGYGRIFVGSRSTGDRKARYAHIEMYRALVGEVPEGLVLDHLCNTRACVNPEHLEPKTRWENVARSETAATAVNARKTHCREGHPLVPMDRGRGCPTCRRRYLAEWYQRRKARHVG